MKITLWVIMALTLSAGSPASVSSLKGSSLKNRNQESRKVERQEEREPEMTSVIGGSQGGLTETERQREEERPGSEDSGESEGLVSCEELRRSCR